MKTYITIILLSLSFLGTAQSIEKGDTLKISNFIGLDSTRTEFFIEPVKDASSMRGYILFLNEDSTFDVFGYGFCGVGEKAFVKGSYTLEKDHKIKLNFDQVIYRDMGKETRRHSIGKEVLYQYDLTKNTLSAIMTKRTLLMCLKNGQEKHLLNFVRR